LFSQAKMKGNRIPRKSNFFMLLKIWAPKKSAHK